MKYLTLIVGIAVFAIVRPSLTLLIVYFPTLSGGAPSLPLNLPAQIVLGIEAAFISLPLPVFLIRRKWARIAVCSLTCGVFGSCLLLYGVWKNHLPSFVLSDAALAVFFLWVLCGVLGAWITEAVDEVVRRKYHFTTAAG